MTRARPPTPLQHLLFALSGAAALPIAAMFVETHERHLPERVAMVKTLHKRNWDGSLPFPIDTFWP